MNYCYYHPDKKAKFSCGECDKYVCGGEKIIHPRIKKKGKNKDNHDYCWPCYYDMKMQVMPISRFGGYTGVMTILYVIIAIFVFIFGSIFVNTLRDGEWIVLLISAFIFLGPAAAFYFAAYNFKKKGDPAADYKKRQSEFLDKFEKIDNSQRY
jgi:hypothetical protein